MRPTTINFRHVGYTVRRSIRADADVRESVQYDKDVF